MKALMKALCLVPITALLVLAPTAAQKPKPSTVAKVKGAVKAAVDTGATKATAAVVDTLLGTGGTRVGADGCPVSATVGTALVGRLKKDLQSPSDTAKRAAAPCPIDPAALQAARAAQTAEQAQLDAQLQAQAAASAAAGTKPSTSSAVGAMAAATPVGLAATAAPVAAKALGGMFGKAQSKESMIKDLSRGRLELKGVRFVGASDALTGEVADDFTALAEALQAIEGDFVLNLPPEQDDGGDPDTVMVRRRLTKLSALLAVAGLSDRLELVSGPPGLDSKRKLPKIGAARVEILRKPSPETFTH